MQKAHLIKNRHRLYGLVISLIICAGSFHSYGTIPDKEDPTPARSDIYDIEAAKEFCDATPLRAPEGIWIYPDDNVSVLILRRESISASALPSYDIQVVETSDVRLRPGDIIGKLTETPESNKFEMELFTEYKDKIFRKPKTCMARLTEDKEVLVLSKDKSKFNFRISFNPSTLLPKLWKILRFNGSYGNNSSNAAAPAVGMVKVYPSYDGNGSSKREPRYL